MESHQSLSPIKTNPHNDPSSPTNTPPPSPTTLATSEIQQSHFSPPQNSPQSSIRKSRRKPKKITTQNPSPSLSPPSSPTSPKITITPLSSPSSPTSPKITITPLEIHQASPTQTSREKEKLTSETPSPSLSTSPSPKTTSPKNNQQNSFSDENKTDSDGSSSKSTSENGYLIVTSQATIGYPGETGEQPHTLEEIKEEFTQLMNENRKVPAILYYLREFKNDRKVYTLFYTKSYGLKQDQLDDLLVVAKADLYGTGYEVPLKTMSYTLPEFTADRRVKKLTVHSMIKEMTTDKFISGLVKGIAKGVMWGGWGTTVTVVGTICCWALKKK